MFLLNSRPGLFTVIPPPLAVNAYKGGTPHLPKLRGHFAEFLKESYLERLPIFWVSTCVGLRYERLYYSQMGFSWQLGISDFPSAVALGPYHSSTRISTNLQVLTNTSNRLLTYPPASPLLLTCIIGSGILTGYPSTTPLGLALGSTNPGRINLPQETLDFRRYGFSP